MVNLSLYAQKVMSAAGKYVFAFLYLLESMSVFYVVDGERITGHLLQKIL